MFAGLRRTQKFIWPVVAVVVIISFVIFFSPQANLPFGGEPRVNLGRLDGEQITQSQYMDARKEAFFRARMYSGRWPENDVEQLEKFTHYQLLINQQIREQGIHVSQKAVSRTALSFGVSDVDAFMKVVPSRGYNLTKDDFFRFCESEAGFRELTQLASTSGQLLSPRELADRFSKMHQESLVESVFFQGSAFTNGITVTPEALGRHYTNNQSQYRIPERIRAAYVEFPKSNYLTQADQTIAQRVTNLTAFLDQEYLRRGSTNFTDPKNPSVILPEKEAKDQLREAIRSQYSLTAAYNQATEVADKMMSGSNATVQVFEVMAGGEGRTVGTTSPFDRDQPPSELKGVSPDVASKLFELTNSAAAVLFTPIMGEDGVYLTAVRQRLPSQVEPLDAVRDRVVADYLKSQGRDLANKSGNSFYTALTNEMATGKSFAEIASANRLRVETLPPFSLSTESLPELSGRMEINQLKNIVSRMTNGAVSRFVFTTDGGAVLHLRERKAVSDALRQEKFANFQREETFQHMNDALGKWFDKVMQAKLELPAPPKTDEPPAAGGAGAPAKP